MIFQYLLRPRKKQKQKYYKQILSLLTKDLGTFSLEKNFIRQKNLEKLNNNKEGI